MHMESEVFSVNDLTIAPINFSIAEKKELTQEEEMEKKEEIDKFPANTLEETSVSNFANSYLNQKPAATEKPKVTKAQQEN